MISILLDSKQSLFQLDFKISARIEVIRELIEKSTEIIKFRIHLHIS